MKKNLKLTVGIAALSAVVFLNLKYAYGGYGLSDNVFPKALATSTATTCGTDENGDEKKCHARAKTQPTKSLCTIFTKTFYKNTIHPITGVNMGVEVVCELKSHKQAVWSEEITAEHNGKPRQSYGVENVDLSETVCIDDSQSGECSAIPANCNDYDGNGS